MSVAIFLFLVAMVIIIIALFGVESRKEAQERWERLKQEQEREAALLKSVTDVDRGVGGTSNYIGIVEFRVETNSYLS